MRLTEATRSEKLLAKVYQLYMEAFPSEERKPFGVILAKQEKGDVEILAVEGEGRSFLGLAIMVRYEDRVLLDYFAVAPECRGGGTGGRALELLKERYAGRRLFLEIESTEGIADCADQRVRRKSFYLRNGMTETGVRVSLFGVEMELLTSKAAVTYEEYFEVYEKVFGSQISDHVKLLE